MALGCPRCHGQLNKQADGKYACRSCSVQFPILKTTRAEIPFLWPEPGAALLDWRNRCNAAAAEIETQIALTSAADHGLSDSASQRLALLQQGYTQYQQELAELWAPLKVGDAIAKETHLALKTKLPSHHGVLSYAQNMHRDWCWGEVENQQVMEHLSQTLDSVQPENVLVLGSGAGRLAYDLHQHLNAKATWALDSNPLLSLLGARMAAGEEISLMEFPPTPISLTDSAVARTLSAPRAIQGLHFVCADALRPPFVSQQFDLVVTPWLLDVIDASVNECLDVIQFLLKPSGLWLNHGSVAFTGEQPENRLSTEELQDMAAARGFDVLAYEDVWLPYMQSPANRQHRNELTSTLLAQSTLTCVPTLAHHQHLPDWIAKGKTPIPLNAGFQTQITTVRVHAFIMSLIDGKRSLQDMAAILEQQRLMPAAEAAQAIRGFLTTMYEETVHKDGSARR
jgi:N2227-like protein